MNLRAQEQAFNGLLHIDDVHLLAFVEDVGSHLRVPVSGTATKMNAGIDEIFNKRHRNVPSGRGPLADQAGVRSLFRDHSWSSFLTQSGFSTQPWLFF